MSIVGFADNYCIISVEKHFSQIEILHRLFCNWITEVHSGIITNYTFAAICWLYSFRFFPNRFTSSWNYYYESFVSGLSKSLFVSVCVYKGGVVSLTKESYRYPIFMPFVPIRHKEYIYGWRFAVVIFTVSSVSQCPRQSVYTALFISMPRRNSLHYPGLSPTNHK